MSRLSNMAVLGCGAVAMSMCTASMLGVAMAAFEVDKLGTPVMFEGPTKLQGNCALGTESPYSDTDSNNITYMTYAETPNSLSQDIPEWGTGDLRLDSQPGLVWVSQPMVDGVWYTVSRSTLPRYQLLEKTGSGTNLLRGEWKLEVVAPRQVCVENGRGYFRP